MFQSTTLFPRQPILHRVLFLSLSSGSLPLALGRPTLFSFFGKAPASSSSSPPLPAAFVFRGNPPPPRLCLASWARCGEKEKWAAISVSPFLKGRRVGWAVNFLRPFYPSSAPFSSSCSFFPLPFPLYLRVAPPFSSSSSTLSSLRRNKAKKGIGDDDVAKSCPCVTPQSEWLSKEIIVCRARKKRQQGGNCEKIVRSTLTCCSSVQSTLVHRREQSPLKETQKKFVMLRSFYSSLGAAEIH